MKQIQNKSRVAQHNPLEECPRGPAGPVLRRRPDQIRRGNASRLRSAGPLSTTRQREHRQAARESPAEVPLGLRPGVEGDNRHGPRPGRTAVRGIRARACAEGVAQVEGGAALDLVGGAGGVVELQREVLFDIVEGVRHAAEELGFLLHDGRFPLFVAVALQRGVGVLVHGGGVEAAGSWHGAPGRLRGQR